MKLIIAGSREFNLDLGTVQNLIAFGIVYSGIQHYTGHHCIALSATVALLLIKIEFIGIKLRAK